MSSHLPPHSGGTSSHIHPDGYYAGSPEDNLAYSSPNASYQYASYSPYYPNASSSSPSGSAHVEYDPAAATACIPGQDAIAHHQVYTSHAVHDPSVLVTPQWFYQSEQSPTHYDYPSHPPTEAWLTEHQHSQPTEYYHAERFKSAQVTHYLSASNNQTFYEDVGGISPVSDGSVYDLSPESEQEYHNHEFVSDVEHPYGHPSSSLTDQQASEAPLRASYQLAQSDVYSEHQTARPDAVAVTGRAILHDATVSSPHLYGTSREVRMSYDRPHRTPSPMGHLPYPEDIERAQHHQLIQSRGYTGTNTSADFTEWHGSNTIVHQPQPQYASPSSQLPYSQPAHDHHPVPIALPAPSRSPRLVEDTPKKPLSLACLFCRKRKIACGSPPPGRMDRTCNQCARRSLKCVYPVASRRGMRPRGETEFMDGIFHPPVIMPH